MNILFYVANEVSVEFGGVERVTARLAESFTQRYQVHCFLAFKHRIDSSFQKYTFEDSVQLRSLHRLDELVSFIESHRIEIVIIQAEHRLSQPLCQALHRVGNKRCRVLFALHVKPGSEQDFIHLNGPKQALLAGKDCMKNLCKCLSLGYKKQVNRYKLPGLYRQSYRWVDRVVLLSNGYRTLFLQYARLAADRKQSLRAIPNAVSFPTFFDPSNYAEKKKEVLIVARFEEQQKRIALALQIWKEIEADECLADWKLRIVGHGAMEVWYRHLVAKYGLQRVCFEGLQHPEPYYSRASVFMMTSSYEGLPLTLLEAQQKGCVPLAFQTFESLADIVVDGKNGFAVPEKDVVGYIERLKRLMLDPDLRRELALQAIEHSRHFSIESVTDQWWRLFEEVLAESGD